MTDARFTASFWPWDHVGLGLAFRSVRITIEKFNQDLAGDLTYGYRAGYGFVSFRW